LPFSTGRHLNGFGTRDYSAIRKHTPSTAASVSLHFSSQWLSNSPVAAVLQSGARLMLLLEGREREVIEFSPNQQQCNIVAGSSRSIQQLAAEFGLQQCNGGGGGFQVIYIVSLAAAVAFPPSFLRVNKNSPDSHATNQTIQYPTSPPPSFN
jgi:hypothetical protein